MCGRIAVLVSGSGSNMVALADACTRGELAAEVVAVLGDRDCPALARAARRAIPTRTVAPSRYPSRSDWSAALLDEVLAHDPDLVVSAGFMRVLAPVFVEALAGRLVNLHPSLLPAFPGAHAVHDALAAGVAVTGSTVHFVDNEVDHGPIILQEPVPVLPGDTEATLHERIKQLEHGLLVRACRVVLSGEVRLSDGRTLVEERA